MHVIQANPSDGRPEARAELETNRFDAGEIEARGIVLDVVGVAMSTDHTLKRKANSYRSADDPDSLVQAVEEIFAEVCIIEGCFI